MARISSGGYPSERKALSLGQSDWTKPIVAILLILVVVLSGVTVYQQQAGLATPHTVTITRLFPCTGDVVWNLNSSSSLIPVLLIQPNSTAYVCETYQTWWKGNPNTNFTSSLGVAPPGPFQLSPLYVGNEVCKPSPYGCRPEISNAFRVSVNPTSVQLDVYADYVSVVYTMTALANSTGYYSNSVQYQGCSTMPLAVGHSASEVNISDFGPEVPASSCVFLDLNPVSVAVSGMGVTYLNRP